MGLKRFFSSTNNKRENDIWDEVEYIEFNGFWSDTREPCRKTEPTSRPSRRNGGLEFFVDSTAVAKGLILVVAIDFLNKNKEILEVGEYSYSIEACAEDGSFLIVRPFE